MEGVAIVASASAIFIVFLLLMYRHEHPKHIHVWTVLEKTEQPSALDVMATRGSSSWKTHNPDFIRRFVIVKRKCEECGTEEVVRV